jgi:hypothetical protein
MAEKRLLATVTGEYFQPVRLHYHVLDQKGLLRAFKGLRCVAHDPPRQRWVWLYEYEAKGLQFKQSYPQLPQHLHPIVIGSFFLRTTDRLLLDLRSFERATQAVVFFDKHIPRSVAEITEAEVVNRLFSADDPNRTPDSIFDHQTSTLRDPEAAVRELGDVAAGIEDPQERMRIALEHVEAQARSPLPEVERFPVHYYEDGIQGFETALRMRQIIAMQHWSGNTGYTMFDVLQAMRKSLEGG